MRTFFSILLISITTQVAGQLEHHNVDSLWEVYDNAGKSEQAVGALLVLGQQVYLQQPDSAMILWNQSLAMCNELLEGNPTNEKLLLEHKSNALFNMSQIYHMNGETRLALEMLEKVLEIDKITGIPENISSTYNDLGIIYSDLGLVTKALDCYHKSLKIDEKLGKTYGLGTTYSNIGQIHLRIGNAKQAYKYFKKSLQLHEAGKDTFGWALGLSNLGGIYLTQEKYDSALTYFQRSLEMNKAIGKKSSIGSVLSKIGDMYSIQSKPSKAIKYYQKAMKIEKEINHKESICNLYSNIGRQYFYQNKLPEAFEFANKSYKLAKELGFPYSLSHAAELLRDIYEQQGNYNQAYKYYKIYETMEDSMVNQQNTKVLVKQEVQYQYEKKMQQDSLTRLKAEQERMVEEEKRRFVEEEKLKRQRLYSYAGAGGFALMLLLAFVLYRGNRNQHKANKEIQEQKALVEEKNKEMVDSIVYAENIQAALLASEKEMKAALGEHFLLYQPKDIVSGDFYWCHQINQDEYLLTVADCTGHGVPGAFMSMLGIAFLNELARAKGITNPGKLVSNLSVMIEEALSNRKARDGMDLTLVHYNKKTKQIQVAGAFNPLLVVRKGEVINVPVDRRPLGYAIEGQIPFENHTTQLEPGDTYYLLTDGYVDQFGGPNGKKIKSARLKNLLTKTAPLPMQEQHQMLQTFFNDWKRHEEQIDDVCVMGVRV